MSRRLRPRARAVAVAVALVLPCGLGPSSGSAQAAESEWPAASGGGPASRTTRVSEASTRSSPALHAAGVSSARYVTGGVVGTVLGYGIGHAVVGEWESVGYLFTTGEVGVVLVASLVIDNPLSGLSGRDPTESGAYVGTMALFIALRVVEAVDVWTRPRVARDALPAATTATQLRWTVAPARVGGAPGALFVGRF